MKLMGATWRRSGLSKAGMRAYYNEVHGPIVAKDPTHILRYVQNVVEDAVFYCKEAHSPITQPDGLTEIWHADQEAFERRSVLPHVTQVSWPDTFVYADAARGVSVVGPERPVMTSAENEAGLIKMMSYVLLPAGTDRRARGLWDAVASTLRAHDLESVGVKICQLVTEFEEPNERLTRKFNHTGPRAVAGITMFLEPGYSWEMRALAEVLMKTTGAAFEAETFVLMMLVSPTVVIDQTGTA